MKIYNIAYSLLISSLFLIALNIFAKAKAESESQQIKHGCYNAPIYIYDERIGKYYRQDWCKSAKQPVFYDSIPVQSERVERRVS